MSEEISLYDEFRAVWLLRRSLDVGEQKHLGLLFSLLRLILTRFVSLGWAAEQFFLRRFLIFFLPLSYSDNSFSSAWVIGHFPFLEEVSSVLSLSSRLLFLERVLALPDAPGLLVTAGLLATSDLLDTPVLGSSFFPSPFFYSPFLALSLRGGWWRLDWGRLATISLSLRTSFSKDSMRSIFIGIVMTRDWTIFFRSSIWFWRSAVEEAGAVPDEEPHFNAWTWLDRGLVYFKIWSLTSVEERFASLRLWRDSRIWFWTLRVCSSWMAILDSRAARDLVRLLI